MPKIPPYDDSDVKLEKRVKNLEDSKVKRDEDIRVLVSFNTGVMIGILLSQAVRLLRF